MFWILLISVTANALLTLGVSWLLFRNGEVLREASQQTQNQGRDAGVSPAQVQRWLNSHRDLVAVVDPSGETPAVRFDECILILNDGGLMIQTSRSDDF